MSTPSLSEREPTNEPGPVGQLARLFLTQLLAVVAVAAVIATVFAVTGRGTGPDVSASTSTAATSATPPATPPATPTTTTSAPATPAPATSAATPGPVSADRPKVDVLNQAAGNGTAGRTANRLRDRGWRIGRVADFHGNVSTTTVYYPPGLRADARALAADLPGAPRLRERFSTLSGSRLSVILVG